MELVALACFFALILAWLAAPGGAAVEAPAMAPIPSAAAV